MGRTRVMESRALDAYYDPLHTTPVQDNSNYQAVRPTIVADGGLPTSGPNLPLYVKRPLVPQLHAVSPGVLLVPTIEQDPLLGPVEEILGETRDVGSQTKYRESEAQTDAYSPDVLLRPDLPQPEVLALQELQVQDGRGLPAGLREVEMVEHARQKRHLEASLPPFTDEASLHMRQAMMEAQELREYRLRDAELSKARDDRLNALQKAIRERDEGTQFLAQQRVEVLRQGKVEDRDRRIARIQQKRIKVLRKLTKERGAVLLPGDERMKRDIIADYANFSSAVYAPVQREGRRTDKDAAKFDVASKTSTTLNFAAIESLESSLKPKMLHTAVLKPNRTKLRAKANGPKSLAVATELERMVGILRAQKEQQQQAAGGRGTSKGGSMHGRGGETGTVGGGGGAGGLGGGGSNPVSAGGLGVDLGSTTRNTTNARRERPQTPRVDPPARPEEEAKFQALLLLQRLLRGRAIQNAIFEGKDRRQELIRELRMAVHMEEEQKRGEVSSPAADALEETISRMREERVRDAALDAIAGHAVCQALVRLAEGKDPTAEQAPAPVMRAEEGEGGTELSAEGDAEAPVKTEEAKTEKDKAKEGETEEAVVAEQAGVEAEGVVGSEQAHVEGAPPSQEEEAAAQQEQEEPGEDSVEPVEQTVEAAAEEGGGEAAEGDGAT